MIKNLFSAIEKNGTGIERQGSSIEKNGTGVSRYSACIEKNGTGVRFGRVMASTLLASVLCAPAFAADFKGMANKNGDQLTISITDGSLLLSGSASLQAGYSVVSLNAVDLGMRVDSEGNGTGFTKSEGNGTGFTSSEGNGTGFTSSEGNGTGFTSSEGNGTGVAQFCLSNPGLLSEGNGTGVASEGNGTGYTKSEGNGTGVASEGNGTGYEADSTGPVSFVIAPVGDGFDDAGLAPAGCKFETVTLSWGLAEVALNNSSASILLYGVRGNGALVELAAIELPVLEQ